MKQRSVNTDARRRTLTIATRVATAAAAARSGTDSSLPEFIVKRREDAARRDSVVAEERAAAAERQKKRFTAHDLLGSLTDDEVEVLVELCGGAAASVEPHAADAQFSLLEMRVGKMFDAAEVGEVIERRRRRRRIECTSRSRSRRLKRAAASPRPDVRRASLGGDAGDFVAAQRAAAPSLRRAARSLGVLERVLRRARRRSRGCGRGRAPRARAPRRARGRRPVAHRRRRSCCCEVELERAPRRARGRISAWKRSTLRWRDHRERRRLFLPLADESALRSAGAAPARAAQSRRIVVAPPICVLLASPLDHLSFTREVRDAHQGVERLRARRPRRASRRRLTLCASQTDFSAFFDETRSPSSASCAGAAGRSSATRLKPNPDLVGRQRPSACLNTSFGVASSRREQAVRRPLF